MTTFTATSSALKSGKRLRQLVTRGLKLQAKIDELAEKKSEVEREVLALIATFDGRDKTDDVALKLGDDVPGHLTVKWSKEYVVDADKAEKLRKRLGDAEFNRVFSVTKKVSRARSFGAWLKEAHGAKIDRFKSAVEAAVTETVRSKPSIKWIYDKTLGKDKEASAAA